MIKVKFKSGNQYCTFDVRGVSQDPQQTQSLQTAEDCGAATCTRPLLWRWWNYGERQQTPRGRRVPGVVHLSAAGQTPFPSWLESSLWHLPSWQQLIKITLIYSCTLPGITCGLKKCIFLEKTDRHHPVIETLSFWAMCNHLRVLYCNSIVFVSYNMLNTLGIRKTSHWMLSIKLLYYALKHNLVVTVDIFT